MTRLPFASPSPPAKHHKHTFLTLLVVYPHLQRQFHEYHAASFFIPISSSPPLPRGFYLIYLLLIIQILFSFLSFNHRTRSKCLIYWSAGPYTLSPNPLPPLTIQTVTNTFHNYPIFILRTIIHPLKIQPSTIKPLPAWFYTCDSTYLGGMCLQKHSPPLTLATCRQITHPCLFRLELLFVDARYQLQLNTTHRPLSPKTPKNHIKDAFSHRKF